jgi:hypothetical protein
MSQTRARQATRQAIYCRPQCENLLCLRYSLSGKVIARAVDRRHKSCSFKHASTRLLLGRDASHYAG